MQNIWKIRLQLTKPVTWPPLVWGVVCGAAASGTKFLHNIKIWHACHKMFSPAINYDNCLGTFIFKVFYSLLRVHGIYSYVNVICYNVF